MQEQVIYIPVHIKKPTPKRSQGKTFWNIPINISHGIRNKLLAVALLELGILSVTVSGDGTAAVAMLFIALSAIIAK